MSLSRPTASPDRAAVATLIYWLGVALALLPCVFTSSFNDDEFITLNNAVRMLGGQVIYKDFFEFTAPLSHWLVTWLFALTGPSLLAARCLLALIIGLTAWQLRRIARNLGLGPWLSTLPGLAFVWGLFHLFFSYSHHWVALPFVLGSYLAATRARAEQQPWRWGLAGASAGAALLAMQTDGLVMGSLLAGFLAAESWCGRSRFSLSPWGALLLGAALPLLPAGLYFLAHGALADALRQVFIWPLGHYRSPGNINDVRFAMDVPQRLSTTAAWVNVPFWYTRLYNALCLLLLLPGAALVGALWLAETTLRRLRGETWSDREAQFSLLAAMGLAFFALATRGRADIVHVAMYGTPALVIATFGAGWAYRRMKAEGRALLGLLPTGAIALYVLTCMIGLGQFVRNDPYNWLTPGSPDARLSQVPSIAYIRAHSTAEDQIAAMPCGGFYYFYGRAAATRYTLILAPQVGYNSEAEFAGFWAEIARRKPRFVVVAPRGTLPHLDEKAELAAYLRAPIADYHLVASPTNSHEFLSGNHTYIYERNAAVGAK